ncbi:M56 family metallopeptidase [Brevundimonas sp.]|uniref:M56 family metallopeptidase n=1 Tax=Brevundimonas sp. TaxID=1871086 RepID=UPI002FC9199A
MSPELIAGLFCKSGVIAGVGLLLSCLPGFRAAADRVDVLRAAVCVLLALPLLVFFAPDLRLELLPAAFAEPAAASAPVWQGSVTPVEGLSLSSSIRLPSPVEVMAAIWLLGAIVVLGRFALGVAALWRWTRTGAPVTDPAWTTPLERLAPRRRPRLISASAVEAPLSWGLSPGVVLVGRTCLSHPETAGAVLAHELAHIRRSDWLFLALSRLALALFWFNPLVWLLHATLASRTEDAADAAALAVVDRRTYARALVGLAADFRQSSAIGMAGSAQSLTRRITRIMNARPASRPRPLTMALAIGALVAVATPISAVEITQRAPLPPAAPSAPPLPPVPPAPPAALAVLAPANLPQPPAPPAPPAPPRLQDGSRITITDDGRTRVYRSVEEMDPETRRAYEQALEEAAAARGQAAEAREQARAARAEGARARAEARVHHAAALEKARAATTEARAAAAEARVQASAAREGARHAMARARVEMRQGADEMDRGADEMREEARRLRDPAYRARQIERARERGDRVPTDAELAALAPRLASQAEELKQQAARLREEAEDPS